jgi:hypothetical protein
MNGSRVQEVHTPNEGGACGAKAVNPHDAKFAGCSNPRAMLDRACRALQCVRIIVAWVTVLVEYAMALLKNQSKLMFQARAKTTLAVRAVSELGFHVLDCAKVQQFHKPNQPSRTALQRYLSKVQLIDQCLSPVNRAKQLHIPVGVQIV